MNFNIKLLKLYQFINRFVAQVKQQYHHFIEIFFFTIIWVRNLTQSGLWVELNKYFNFIMLLIRPAFKQKIFIFLIHYKNFIKIIKVINFELSTLLFRQVNSNFFCGFDRAYIWFFSNMKVMCTSRINFKFMSDILLLNDIFKYTLSAWGPTNISVAYKQDFFHNFKVLFSLLHYETKCSIFARLFYCRYILTTKTEVVLCVE